MSLENNKNDFEQALHEMKDVVEELDHCVDDGMMNTLRSVISEYETHYSSDIQDLIDENEELKDRLEGLRE
jgi:chaperonin cofactor prefoldin